MFDTVVQGLSGLGAGTSYLFTSGGPNVIMLLIAATLLYLGVKKEVEPLLLVPIGFGCMLVNIPLSDLMEPGGLLRILYDMGISNELFPLLIFVGIGAMIDFGSLLENPKMLLFGAAGQFGIFLTLLLALALGFPALERDKRGMGGFVKECPC